MPSRFSSRVRRQFWHSAALRRSLVHFTATPARLTDVVTQSQYTLISFGMHGDLDLHTDTTTASRIFTSDRKSGEHIVRMNGAHDSACAGNKTRHALHFVLYDFRHTFATQMAQTGVDLATLAAILGHSSLRVVQKYVHPTAIHQQQAMHKFEESLIGNWKSGNGPVWERRELKSVRLLSPSVSIQPALDPRRKIENELSNQTKTLNLIETIGKNGGAGRDRTDA
jgi:hypothetical protein